MTTRIYRFVFVCLMLSIGGIVQAQEGPRSGCADPSSSLLWEIEGSDSTVYLFGSLHLGDASFYPLPETIESTLHSADHVVFEVDPRSMTTPEVQARIQRLGSLSSDEELSDLVSQPVIDELAATIQDMGLPSENFMEFRPWFLTLMLTSLQATSMGYVPDYGVEQYVLRETAGNAEILELEGVDEQINYLQHLDGEAFLAYTLSSFDAGKQKLKLTVDAWRCANKAQLSTLLLEEFDAEGPLSEDMDALKDKLIVERNIMMAEKIRDYLQSGQGSYFVVVGAAHYLGEDSVVELLRGKDYRVRPVSL